MKHDQGDADNRYNVQYDLNWYDEGQCMHYYKMGVHPLD